MHATLGDFSQRIQEWLDLSSLRVGDGEDRVSIPVEGVNNLDGLARAG